MLVRDLGDRFQIVLQPDHGDVSGQLAAAWAADDLGLSPGLSSALVLAAARHDDGWSVWERHPRLDAQNQPQSFLDAPRESLLSSYQACVDVLALEDPGAALLVSMHVSGLNRNRYGVMDSPDVTPIEELSAPVARFVREEEARQAELTKELGFGEEERWRAYRQLQVYDVLSLYLGLADLDNGGPTTIHALELQPVGPSSISCDPFPFADDPLHVTMRRRVLQKRAWADEAAFESDFNSAAVEDVHIEITANS